MTDTTWSHELIGDHSTWRIMRLVRTADRHISRHEIAMCRDGIADIRRVTSLAKWLAAATDQVQQAVCGTVVHSSWSHRTCLDAVDAALHAHPIPWGADGDTKQKWLDQLVERAADLVDVAAGIEDAHRTALRQGA